VSEQRTLLERERELDVLANVLAEAQEGRAVAVAMAQGPQAGLALLEPLDTDNRLSGHHRLPAVRAHLLEMAGDHEAARSCYRAAARLTTSLPEQHYLQGRAARLTQDRR